MYTNWCAAAEAYIHTTIYSIYVIAITASERVSETAVNFQAFYSFFLIARLAFAHIPLIIVIVVIVVVVNMALIFAAQPKQGMSLTTFKVI